MNQAEKKPIYKKWWFWLICIAIIAGIAGATGSNNSSEPAQTDQGTLSGRFSEIGETEEPSIDYIAISATDLIIAYDNNEIAADNQYKGQWLEVSGTVQSIGKDILDASYVTLQDERNEYAIISVQCYFDDKNLDGIAQLSVGDQVTIRGQCDGSSINVLLKKCDLIQ